MTSQWDAARAVLEFWEDAGVDVSGARTGLRAPAAAPTAPQPARPLAAPVRREKAEDGPASQAAALAAAAGTIPDLAAAIAGFDGCALKKSARSTVVFDGALGAPLLAIGEAPGADEDLAGKPFVGRAGQLLDKMLGAIDLSRDRNVLISNAVYWRPPGNRTPNAEELAICRPFVERLITLAAPKALLLVGGAAAQSVLGATEGVMRLRGKRLSHAFAGLTTPVNVMVMLHPAYLLRQPAHKKLAWADLLALQAWLAELTGG